MRVFLFVSIATRRHQERERERRRLRVRSKVHSLLSVAIFIDKKEKTKREDEIRKEREKRVYESPLRGETSGLIPVKVIFITER